MKSVRSIWVGIGCVSAGLSVAMGAFGAHGLAQILDARAMNVFQTAARYQMYHALALIGLGLWEVLRGSSRGSRISGWAFTGGTLVFSGSLYLNAITGIGTFGAITPLGGLAFLTGWACWAWDTRR